MVLDREKKFYWIWMKFRSKNCSLPDHKHFKAKTHTRPRSRPPWVIVYEFPQIHIADFENFLVENQHFFLINSPKDSPCSCHHFHHRPLVVGGHLRRRNQRKQQKNAINYICFVTSSMTSALWVIHHPKALDLKFQDFGRLSAAITWWRSGSNWTKPWKRL